MTTTNPSRPRYCDALRRQLDAAGEAALDMIGGRAPVDETIVLAAIDAAGLLSAETAGASEPLRARVTAAAMQSPLPDALVRDHLDLSPMEWPSDEDPVDREARVHRLVALAAVQAFVSTSERWRLANAVGDAEARIVAEPERFADLSGLATFLEDQLDLPDSHAAMAFLRPLRRAATFAADPLPASLLEGALARAKQSVAQRSRRSWRDAIAHWGQAVQDFFAQQAAQPVFALAADDDTEVLGESPTALLWNAEGRGYLSLVAAPSGLQVEWYGEEGVAPPLSVRLRSDEALESVGQPFPGAVRWALPDVPPAGVPSLVLSFEDGEVVFPESEPSDG